MLDLLKVLAAAIVDWIIRAPTILAAVIVGRLSGREPVSSGQKKKAIAGGLIMFVAIVALLWQIPCTPEARHVAEHRIYMCSETGKTFEHEPREGDVEPIESPHSGNNTGWLAEACYWTPDGQGGWKAKEEPTYVILKSRMDPESAEPTRCPDCRREVVGHNPRPSP